LAIAALAAAPTAAQDDAALLAAHNAEQQRLVSEANSVSGQALDALSKGDLAGAVALRRKALAAYEGIVADCGRVQGRVVFGCFYDESAVADAARGLASALHDQGKAKEGVKAFEDALARQEARWRGCGTPAWDFTCEEAAEKRLMFLGSFAFFLENHGMAGQALDLRRRILAEREPLLAACKDKQCDDAAYWALRDYGALRDTLAKAERPAEVPQLDAAWLPRLLNAPLYAKGKAAGADTTATGYAEGLDAILTDLAAAATPESAALLRTLGRGEAVAAQADRAEAETRLAALKQEYGRIGITDYVRRAANVAEQARVVAAQHGAGSREHGMALIALAREQRLADQHEAAADAWRQALAIHRKNEPAGDFRVLASAEGLALALEKAGRPGEAIAVLGDVLADPANDQMALYTDPERSRALGYGIGDTFRHLNVAHALLARLILAHGGDISRALASARHASTGVSAYRRALGSGIADEESLDAAERSPEIYTGETRFGAFATLLTDALWAAGQREGDGRTQAFEALQEATAGTTTSALARGAADRVARQSGAGPLLARRQALTTQITQVTRALLYDGLAGQAYTDASYKQRRLADQREQVDRQIAAAAPDYFALIRPRPLDLAQAQALLGPDEAALIAVPSAFGTHVFVVTREGLAWHRADLPEDKLNRHVRRLLWDVGGNVDATPQEFEAWSKEGQGAFPFDRRTAHLLYRELVAPVAARFENKRHLFVIGGGALSSLPFAMLVTEPPQGQDGNPDDLRGTNWLNDRIALLQLPSLQSLQLLRLVAQRGAAKGGDGLLGYGDPVLLGQATSRGLADARARTRSATLPPGITFVADGSKRPLADVERLRLLARLPGTAVELAAMQREFGDSAVRLRMADEATEARFKREKLTGLSVLAFATHGLLAGEARELGGWEEPGLVLTPPEQASELEDGLLTASEIARLDISAEWVVLSACNTAAGDGSGGAAGLSGLARSFFFAGARSLLASHWYVRDDVAAVLTVEVLRQHKANPGWSRAQALQAAMKVIRADPRADGRKDTWAHPRAWAPFTLVGDWRD